MKKNDRLPIRFTQWSEKGLAEGAAFESTATPSDTVKVAYAAPGDEGIVHITKAKGQERYGKLISIRKPSPHRVTPPCPIFGTCGGCQLQHVTEAEQQHYKRQRIAQLLQLKEPPEYMACHTPYHYRNKAQFTIDQGHIGLSAPRSQRIVDCDSCAIQHPLANQVLACVKPYLTSANLTHLVTRVGVFTNELMVGLVSDSTPDVQPILDELTKLPELKSVYLNHNPNPKWQVMGESETLLWGQPRIQENIAGLTLTLSLRSFFQVNSYQIEPLWQQVAQLVKGAHIWDLYCGSGGMSLYLAKTATWVTGVENHPEAIKDAHTNAQVNQITNITFIEADASTISITSPCDTIVIDPPRKGLTPSVIATIQSAAPSQVIYISCNPDSLADDLKKLTDYTIDKVVLVDIFPQTHHVETIVSLTKKSAD